MYVCMYICIIYYIYYIYYGDCLCTISLKVNVTTDEGNGQNEMSTLDKEVKLE